MAQYFRIEIDQPATKTQKAKSWVWTPDDDIVESADLDLRKEGKRISSLSLTIWDPRKNGMFWPIANALPDPAFVDVPIRVYLSKPDEGQSASKLVFDGKITSLQPSFPAASNVTIVAHDRSIDLRKQALYRTFKNKTSVQIAQAIASDYGYTVDTSELIGIVTSQRLIDIGMGAIGLGSFSDWNHITRALAVDGLELYVVGKKIKVRQLAQQVYPHTFSPDDGLVLDFKPTINHVSGPGAGGQSKVPVPGGNRGANLSVQGAKKAETDAEKADANTHRTKPQGPGSNVTGAHTEGTGNNSGPSVQHRKRKDEATLTFRAQPDMGLQHILFLSGWGGKFDGRWHLSSLKHYIAGRSHAVSTATLTREPSDAAQKAIGVQPGGSSIPGGSK